jgi:photosystem II stability/assembly factor-like uncharacterized protein
MPHLSRRTRAVGLIAVAAVLIVITSVAYLRPGGGATQPGSTPRPPVLFLGPAQFLSASTGWVAQGDSLLATSDGGRHWRRIRTLLNMTVTWIRLFDERHGLVLESSKPTSPYVERLARTDDGGAHWTAEQLPANDSMVQVASVAAFPDRTHGWYRMAETAGSGPKDLRLYRTEDGGRHWARIVAIDYLHSADHGLVRGGEPNGLHFTNAEIGWLTAASVLVEDAVLSMTTDGGSSWQTVTLPEPPRDSRPLSYIGVPKVFPDGTAVVSAFRGFINETEYVYRSSDGGRTWGQPVQLQQPSGITSFLDSSHWWHAAGTLSIRTADGGRNWHRGGRPPDGLSFTWLQPISQRSGWALGSQVKAGLPGGELLRTDDAAVHWSAIPLDR